MINFDDTWMRIADNLTDRVTGPMKFRLILQPLMASAYAIFGGLKDAKAGAPPFFWGLASHPEQRREMLRDGWKGIGKVFMLALILDCGYQIYVMGTVYPGEAIIVAIVLAILPYLILRGLVNRITRLRAR